MAVAQEMVLCIVMNGFVFFVHVLDPGVRKRVLYIQVRKNDATVKSQ